MKRSEESRDGLKTKGNEKSKIIKNYQDRESELIENRDKWKSKYQDKNKEYLELNKKHEKLANILGLKKEELREINAQLNTLKKKMMSLKKKPG